MSNLKSEQMKAVGTVGPKPSSPEFSTAKQSCGCAVDLPDGFSTLASRDRSAPGLYGSLAASGNLQSTRDRSDVAGDRGDVAASFLQPNVGHDFGRVSIVRLKPTVSEQNSRANDQISDRSQQSVQPGRGATHALSLPKKGDQDIVDLLPVSPGSGRRDFQVSKPELGAVNIPESSATARPEIINLNGDGGADGGAGAGGGAAGGAAGGGGGGGPAQAAGGTICDQPIGMHKVVSGSFLGGRSMDDYYPDLAGMGLWQHGASGGPFNTGSRVGANAQLWGDFRIPCRPDLFSLAQTVTYARAIFNGVHDPNEGVVQDDIAASGRDYSRAPARQEFGPAGGGWAISMADPPSIGLTPTLNAEFDRDFVTTLIGPTGRSAVNWSTSIRVVNGSVTRNTIT
jgi:hypothetical protein